MTALVQIARDGAVATITLDRPKSYNALNAALRRQLADAIANVEADATVKVVILTGAGKGFCAGADLKEPSTKTSGAVLEQEFRPCLEPIWNSSKLYIAAVHGHAAGIGAALVLACDLVVMEHTSLLTLAFAAIGLVPDGGLCWHLSRALGPRRALEAILEGQSLDAGFCMDSGLCNKVVASGQALPEAEAWARTLAQSSPLAGLAAKRLIRQSMDRSLSDVFSLEAQAQTALAQSGDHARGVAAFLARETPVFQGD